MKNKRIDDELLQKSWPEASALKDNSIIAICGPTASGKSALALRLAQSLDGEIVSCDSMQIYRHLDIGTAKASPAERAAVPHHLLDICDVQENYSLARYVQDAKLAFADIRHKGKIPILVGGTAFYLSALVEKMDFPEHERNLELRKTLQHELEISGAEAMHSRLQMLDPVLAAQTHPHNVKRVLRSLERLLSQTDAVRQCLDDKAKLRVEGETDDDFRVFCLSMPRDRLYARINRRVEQMIDQGLLNEAQWLLEQQLPHDSTCMQAIGYKELFPYLQAKVSLAEAVERLQINSRQYAKRQLSWFRAKNWLLWLFEEDASIATERILKQISR